MQSNKLILCSFAAILVLGLFASVNSVAVRSRQSSNAAASNTSSVNSSDIYNGTHNNNTRFQLCPTLSGDNININKAIQNLTAGLGNDITGNQSGFNGDYASGIVNSLGAAGTALNDGFANIDSSIGQAAADVYNGAANVVKGAGNKIADAAYDVGNLFSSGKTVSSTENSNSKSSSQNVNNTIESARQNVSNILSNQSTWTQGDSNYNDAVVDLRAILYLNQDYIAEKILIDNSSMLLNNKSECTFVSSGAYPSNSNACENGFNVIQPYLVNFGLAAGKNDTVAALYWILQILPGMPDLSNACLNTGFTLIERSFDLSNCEEQIQDLAVLIGDLENGNYFSSATQQLNNRYIITRYVPRIIAYCLGTQN